MTVDTPTPPPSSRSRARTRDARDILRGVVRAREFPVALALVVVVLGTTAANPRFLSTQGRVDLLVAVAITGLMAVGQTFVIVMKHVDLSVGSTLGLSAYLAASVVRGQEGGGLLTVFGIGLLVGVAVGVVNGALVAFLKLPSLVVTLGTLYVVKGIQAVVVGGTRINANELPGDVVDFGRSSILGVPHLMWVCLIAAAVATWFMRTRRTGRDLYAVGSNGPAARLVGIPVWRREMLAFTLSGASAGVAGVLFLSRFGGVDATAGAGYELAGRRRLRGRRRGHHGRRRHRRRRAAGRHAAAKRSACRSARSPSRSSGSRR